MADPVGKQQSAKQTVKETAKEVSKQAVKAKAETSSFLLSAYISLINPIDSSSISPMEIPSCTHRSRNSGVVISRSVERSFF